MGVSSLKILFIGHVRERSGWGNTARDWIAALLAAGVDLTVRSIDFEPTADLSPEIVECMRKTDSNYDAVIQNVIPSFFEYHSGAGKNIGLFFLDSFDIQWTPWAQKIAIMDEIWVTNKDDLSEVLKYNSNSHVVNPAVNLNKYEKVKHSIEIPGTEGNSKIYFIGELNPRKNIGALIKAFYLTFTKNDPVSLVLKLTCPIGPEKTYQVVSEDIKKIADDMKLYPEFSDYPIIQIITDYMSDEDIIALHNSCDCLVIPSFAEGFCLPALDALAVGNKVIGTNVGGLRDMTKYGLTPIGGTCVPVSKMRNLFTNVFTSWEKWYEIDLDELCAALNYWYKYQYDKKLPKQLEEFSYENVANRMIERIMTL
jgi:glycosyltransferase involved in cell wall biosynthesis